MKRIALLTLVAVFVIGLLTAAASKDQEGPDKQTSGVTVEKPPAAVGEKTMEEATFAAGCFWGVEARFRAVPGVVDTMVGYTGGTMDNPSYRAVCTDRTGHTEAVQVTYDPATVSYEELLDVFWVSHDPTQVNRQGPDVGTQYRSAIFFHTPEQKAVAEKSKKALDASGRYDRPVATAIEPAATFWRAEDYHQQYYEKKGLPNMCFWGNGAE